MEREAQRRPRRWKRQSPFVKEAARAELELKLIQSHMAQKPVLRGEVGCACVAREVGVRRRGKGKLYLSKGGAGLKFQCKKKASSENPKSILRSFTRDHANALIQHSRGC